MSIKNISLINVFILPFLGAATLLMPACANSQATQAKQKTESHELLPGMTVAVLTAWNDGEMTELREYFHPQVKHSGEGEVGIGKPTVGFDAYAAKIHELRTGFPDIEAVIIDSVVDGDQHIVIWQWVGTHSGPYSGMAPTGQRLVHSGRTVYTFKDGRVADVRLEKISEHLNKKIIEAN